MSKAATTAMAMMAQDGTEEDKQSDVKMAHPAQAREEKRKEKKKFDIDQPVM